MELLKKLDNGMARLEGRVTVLVLLLMVLTAGFQAFVRNLTRFDIAWANEMLTDMEWADSLLRKGTMWLAFLGASLATYARKHIGIDVLTRIAPAQAKYTMRALSGALSGVIVLGLTYCFCAAVYLNLTERPLEYELLGADGPIHVCDATAAELGAIEGLDRPTMFCAARSVLGALTIPAETPGAAFQLIVPLMSFVIALRLIAQGIGAGMILAGGPAAVARADAAERAAEKATNEAVGSMNGNGGAA
ncbi:MAG: TRAP transporter small permease subunit [Myxococcales bacterium]|nr:TRAP transporter small permease subunit [Myxococcales bacterium]MDD9964880.1 TRAP transporter small permease subunit [Myxococcales bacterium]